MSKLVLNTICVSLLGLSFGYGITRFMHNEYEMANRSTASIPLTKIGLDQASYDYIDMKIENVTVAEKKEDTSLVQVRITALKDIPVSLNYKWILGKEVTASDSLEGVLDPMTQGQSKIYELRVQNYSREWQSHVSLNLSGDMIGHMVARDVIISSRPEDSFEYVVQQAALAKESDTKGRMLKSSNGKSASDKFRRDNIVR
ncbi:hypothetical protein CIK05_14960 [Bdellovibrio sp. qaytius]|nr:hypothetical protein CIK05_14960 [Bdellovibrio sp. qaytius]